MTRAVQCLEAAGRARLAAGRAAPRIGAPGGWAGGCPGPSSRPQMRGRNEREISLFRGFAKGVK